MLYPSQLSFETNGRVWPFVAGEGETIGSKAIVTKQSILLVHVTDYAMKEGMLPAHKIKRNCH